MDPTLLTAASSAVMALIWIVYLQLALSQHRRSSRPFLVIHHARDNDPDAPCLFVNMSREPVHVQCVLLRIQDKEGLHDKLISDYDQVKSDGTDLRFRLRQGPIEPGGYLILGSFRELLLGNGNADKTLANIQHVEICVAVVHGPSSHPIGARRFFEVKREGNESSLHAFSIHTEQLVSRRKRATVRRWIESGLQPRHRGSHQNRNDEQTANAKH
jgi:hypothetical protein